MYKNDECNDIIISCVELHQSAGMEGKELYKNYLKRVIDIALSLSIIGLLWPIFLAAAALIKAEDRGPAIFRQTRIGKNRREFKMFKFRSMAVGAEHSGSGVYSGSDDERVTKIGRLIRATSIDELPQVINILKGDMSFIGPRPPLTYHPWPICDYSEEELRMFEVRPGITGWAQVNGRKNVEWHKRIGLNVWYVDHCSLLLDLKIFFMTILQVISNKDNANTFETVRRSGKDNLGDRINS